MLTKLKINNYALIDSLEISFNKGMTSITGETGAGKSIILGGLSMVLGSRVDNSKIINKEEKCFVEASFDLTDLDIKDYFTKNDLDYDQNSMMQRLPSPALNSQSSPICDPKGSPSLSPFIKFW